MFGKRYRHAWVFSFCICGAYVHGCCHRLRACAARSPLRSPGANKGGPEVALALHELNDLPAAEQQAVRGWVSVGGMLRGTPLADAACQWPLSWLVHLMLWAKGLDHYFRDPQIDIKTLALLQILAAQINARH
jgi:hypothetical protein